MYQNSLQFIRNPQGQLQRIHHSDGYTLLFDYNEAGQRTGINLLEDDQTQQNIVRFCYHDSGYLAACDNQFGSSRYWDYNEAGCLTDWGDSLDTKTHLTLDHQHRVIAVNTSGAYNDYRIEYDDTAGTTTTLDETGEEWIRYTFDDNTQLGQVENARGEISRYEYNDGGYQTAQINPLGERTEYAYDDNMQINAVTLPDGSQTQYRYSSDGYLECITDPAGNHWNYTYDTHGNLTRSIDPTGVIVQFDYDEKGNLITASDAKGMGVQYVYSQQQRLIKITDPFGHSTQLQRDKLGRITAVEDAKGNLTQYLYEPQQGRPFDAPSQIIYPDDTTIQRQWNSEGLLVQHTDPKGNATHYRYGAFDHLLEITDPSGNALHLDYDNAERLRTVTNAQGEQWQFIRDNSGRIIKETDFAGRTNRYGYDPLGRLVAQQHPDDLISRYQYDSLGRLTFKASYPNSDPLKQPQFDPTQHTAINGSESHYQYDNRGLLIHAHNDHSQLNFSHDSAGRVIEESQNGHTLQHQYDLISGRRERLELPSGAEANFHYGPLGMLLNAQLSDHEPLRFSYDQRGQETSRHTKAGFQLQQHWDKLGRLDQQFTSHYDPLHPAAKHPSADATVQRQYHYDPLDNLSKIVDAHQGDQQYHYTSTNQASEAQHPQHYESYEYTTTGNIQQSTVENSITPEQISQWQHQAGGAISAQTQSNKPNTKPNTKPQRQYTYDTRGRITQKIEQKNGFRQQTTQYRWDTEDRLTDLITPQGKQWHYTYDVLGRRISKQEIKPDTQNKTSNKQEKIKNEPDNTNNIKPEKEITEQKQGLQTNHHHYLWDGATLVEEVPLYADGTPAWDNATTWHYQPDSFVPLGKEHHGTLHYIVTDHLGTPKELLTEQGEKVWSKSYSLWGKILNDPAANDPTPQAQNDDPINCNLRFQGQYYDKESGLHYNYHRYYDPDSAQYLTPDPIGLQGGMRPQGYVTNPTGWVDPLGLADYVYRGLHPAQEQAAANGTRINPANINATYTVQEHVEDGRLMTQYLSTTKSEKTASFYAKRAGASVIRIDLDKIDSVNIIDISDGKYKGVPFQDSWNEERQKLQTPSKWAIKDKEVLVKGGIPNDAYDVIKVGKNAKSKKCK